MSTERVNIAISKPLHTRHTAIARLLGKTPLRGATEEAIHEWNERNAAKASKRSQSLLAPKAV